MQLGDDAIAQIALLQSQITDLTAQFAANGLYVAASLVAFASQPTWWINASIGNDANDGTQATQGAGKLGPLKTITEWARRIIAAGGIADGVDVVVHFGTGTPRDDEPRGVIRVKGRSSLRFDGAPGISVIRTSTVGALTARAAATNVPWSFTDGTFDWSTVTQVPLGSLANPGVMIRNTTAGARLNSRVWPAKAISAGLVRTTTPCAPIDYSAGAYATSQRTIVSGDTYSLERLPMISAWGLSFDVNGYNAGVTRKEAVVFNDLAFGLDVPAFICFGGQNGLAFYNCYLGYSYPFSVRPWSLVNCQTLSLAAYGNFQLLGGMNLNGLSLLGNQGFVDLDYLVQGGATEVSGTLVFLGSVQAYDSTSFGVLLDQGSGCIFLSFLGTNIRSGTCLGSNFIKISGGTIATYGTSTAGFTGLGSGGAGVAVNIGPDNVTCAYAALPKIVSDISGGSGTKMAGLVLA